MELLVTVAILGIVALIGMWQFFRTVQRSTVEGAADNVRAFMQRAGTEMKLRGRATFIELAQKDGRWEVRLWEDLNESGTLDAEPTDTLRGTLVLPRGVALSTQNAAQIETTNWSVNSADAAARHLGCDTLSRTFSPALAQIQGVATLAITHERMLPLATPALSPTIKYEVRVSPVWSVALQRLRWNTASNTWSKL